MSSSKLSKQSQSQDVPFFNWVHKNIHQKPKLVSQYYRNLQKPLDFLRNKQISKLDRNVMNTRKQLHYDMQRISDFSNSIYKKVITRDNVDYIFGSNANINNDDDSQILNPIRNTVQNALGFAMSRKQKKQRMNKQYRFGQNQYKKKNILENTNDQTEPLQFSHIKLIDTPQFNKKAENCEFYQVFCTDKPYPFVERALNPLLKLSQAQAIQKSLQALKYNLIQQDAYIGQKSKIISFNFTQQMQFYKKIKRSSENNETEQDIIGICSNLNLQKPDFFDLLDVAAGFITTEDIYVYQTIKIRHKQNKQTQKNTQNLQQRYLKVKKQLQQIKDDRMKNRQLKVPIKWSEHYTQTLDPITDNTNNQFFESSVNENLIQLQKVKKIRQKVLQRQKNKNERSRMLLNCNEKIRQILFKILILTTNGQKIRNYSQLMHAQFQRDVQKRLLDTIYQDFNSFSKQSIDGIPKIKIMEIYIKERRVCDQIMEIVNDRWN